MDIGYLQEKRQEIGMTYHELSERSGVPYNTVCKIFTGVSKNPRMEAIQAIEKALGVVKHAPPPVLLYDEQVLIDSYRKLSAREQVTLLKIMQAAFDQLQDIPVKEVGEYISKHTAGRKQNNTADI